MLALHRAGILMADWSALVKALYSARGGWKEVATACGANGHTYSPGCFWNIAHGKTRRPTPAVRKAILAGLASTPECVSLAVKASAVRDRRKTVHPDDEDHAAGNLERIQRGLTWPQMIHEWRQSHVLMRREYEEKERPRAATP